MLWTISKSSFRNPSGSSRKSYNVNDEYTEVFRTKSYEEIWERIRSQLGLSSRRSLNPSSSSSSSATSSSLPRNINLSDGSLLEEQEDFLVDIVNVSKVNNLAMDYLKVGLEACKVCENLLQTVQKIKANHRLIKRIIKLTKRVLHDSMDDDYRQECIDGITRQLASCALLENPISSFSQDNFRDIQIIHSLLLKELKAKYQKLNRRRKIKKAMGCNLLASFTRLLFSLLALIFRKIMGFVVARPLFGGCLGPIKKLEKLAKKGVKKHDHERLSIQVDVAARGIYTLIKDFDMMSRLGWRLHDEIEHVKSIADVCVRVSNGVVWKEVVKEFESKESMFLELLEEFEKHIYLCLLNVERSKRQLVGKIIVNDDLSVSTPFLA